MKKVTLLIAICVTLLAGCATARGIAQDAENLARGIKRSISK